MAQTKRSGRRFVILASLASLALLLSLLLLTGHSLLSSTNTPQSQDEVAISIGTPDLFGCGSTDPETGGFVTECVNASVTSESTNSFAVLLSASFANSTTGAVIGSGFKSQNCHATQVSSSCLILVSLGKAGSYNMTILAVGADGKTIPSSPREWTVIYEESLVSEGMGG